MSYLLVAEDDLDDCFLVAEAWQEACFQDTEKILPRFVHDGKDLLSLLASPAQLPALILLDLNMPVLDGRHALEKLKSNQETCEIPVIVLSTSNHQNDIQSVYSLGASGFIQKPSSYEALVDIMKNLTNYWFKTVSLPESKR
jgi:CheY-like chemotaxis protein